MNSKPPYVVFVTVGSPLRVKPIEEKKEVEVNDAIGETPLDAAKRLRKEEAEKIGLRPEQLYYEIYMKEESAIPFAASINSPFLNMG